MIFLKQTPDDPPSKPILSLKPLPKPQWMRWLRFSSPTLANVWPTAEFDCSKNLYTPTCILRPKTRVTSRPSLSKRQRLKPAENGLKWHFWPRGRKSVQRGENNFEMLVREWHHIRGGAVRSQSVR